MSDDCVLEQARGRFVACSGEACPFWEPGGAVLGGGCVLERIGIRLAARPELVARLVQIRHALERDSREAAARSELAGLLALDDDPPAGGAR